MKRPREGAEQRRAARRNRHLRNSNPDRVTEMLRLCLEKVCELQAELEGDEGAHDDPHAAGYAACAAEAFRFLEIQGLAPGHPIVRALKQKLLPESDQDSAVVPS